MTPPKPARRIVRVEAHGVAFDLHDDVDLAGLSSASSDADAVATAVWHDPAGLEERWQGATPTRTREMRDGDDLVLTVDHDADRGYLLRAPHIGAALISGGGLEVRCAPDARGPDWEALLIGQVLPLVSTLRGFEVFHAAGIVLGDHSYILCAPPGLGKTSLATQLVMAGAALLSDDVVAVDDDLIAHPGTTILHVRTPELQCLGTGPLQSLRAQGPVRDRIAFAAESLGCARPLGGVYLLERAATRARIESVTYPNPFSLLGATFNLSVRTAQRLSHHLELCAQLAERVPIHHAYIVQGCDAAELAAALWVHIGWREVVSV